MSILDASAPEPSASSAPAPSGRVLSRARQLNDSGGDFLKTGALIGVMGVAGAALGAVCPLCVVATPAFLGLGVVQKLRAAWLRRTQRQPVAADAELAPVSARSPVR